MMLIVIVMLRKSDAEVIYKDAITFNITGLGYVWIVTEQALLPSNTPIGTVKHNMHMLYQRKYRQLPTFKIICVYFFSYLTITMIAKHCDILCLQVFLACGSGSVAKRTSDITLRMQ